MPKEERSPVLVRVAAIPTVVWGPFVAGFLILVVSLIGWATGRPLLFPSLGPSAFEDAEKTHLESSRLYHTVIGHWIGLGAGFAAVAILNAWDAPVVLSTHILTLARVGASVIAVMLTLVLMTLMRAAHPSAAATTLLVSLGAFRTAYDAVTVIIGVVILAAFGEALRQLRLRALEHAKKLSI